MEKRERKDKIILNKRTKELIFYCCLIAIPLVQFAIMYVAVNINSILLAFKSYEVNLDGTSLVKWVGFANFGKFFQELFQAEMGQRLLNSLITYFWGLGTGTVLALFFSYYIYKEFAGSRFFRYMLMLPSFISPVVLVMIYMYVMDKAIPTVLGTASPFVGPVAQQLVIVLLYQTLAGFGMGVLMYSNAMSRVPVSVIEYGRLEGISPIREFFSIILPLIYPTIETFLIIGLAGIFTNQANLFTFFDTNASYPIQTIGYWLYKEVFSTKATMSSYPYMSAAGLVFTAITIPVVMTARHFLSKLDQEVEF